MPAGYAGKMRSMREQQAREARDAEFNSLRKSGGRRSPGNVQSRVKKAGETAVKKSKGIGTTNRKNKSANKGK